MTASIRTRSDAAATQVAAPNPFNLAASATGAQPATLPAPRIPGPRRYHEFDALRGFAMLLGILLHGMLSFVVLPVWPAQDIHQNSEAYGFFQHAIHGFRMPVFFLMSGFFTAMMWRKRGALGLVAHRARRILVPLIIGTIALWPLMIGVVQWGAYAKERAREKRPVGADLWTAAKAGELTPLRQLIEQGADVNARDSLGVSPLEWAAIHDHPDAIALLIANGAEVNGRNPDGSTPLHAAAFLGRTNAARKLVELGADPKIANKRGDTALAAARVDMGIVRFLAGILQVRMDEESVVNGKRETANYLETFEPTIADHRNRPEPATREPDGSTGPAAVDALAEPGDGSDEGNEFLRALYRIYLAAAFVPVFHHLWFLYYLLWLVVLFLIAVSIRAWCPVPIPGWIITTPWCWLWLLPLTLLPQLFMTQTFGADTATGLLPWLPKLGYYAVFFGFGALCFGRPEFEERAGARWVPSLVAALPVLLAGLYLYRGRDGSPAGHILISICTVAYAWLMIFGLIGLFRRCFASENSWIRYLSDAAYWLYLAHLPLIMALQVLVSRWDVHHFPKFLLVCALTFAILLAAYEYLVRYTFVGAALNGRKTRPG